MSTHPRIGLKVRKSDWSQPEQTDAQYEQYFDIRTTREASAGSSQHKQKIDKLRREALLLDLREKLNLEESTTNVYIYPKPSCAQRLAKVVYMSTT